MNKHDVIITGAGIIGLSVAWQLARRASLRILVLDKGAGVGEGSTGASSAVCRHRYTSDDMVALARDGIAAYRHWREFTGLDAPVAAFQQDGVLWMPGEDRAWADREHARMQAFGIPTEVLDDDALRERFPALSPCTIGPDVETGEAHDCTGGGRHFLELEGGWVDPVAAAQDLLAACRGAGVEVRFRARVEGVDTDGGRVTGVTLADGERLSAPLLLNAAGPWCRALNAAAGLETRWDLAPIRIQVVYRDLPPEVPRPIPVVADFAAGIYFRTQNRSQQLLVSSILEEDEREEVADPDRYAVEHDEEFQHVKLHLLHHRIPSLPWHGQVRGYCGLYTVNRDDVHPVLGPTELDGFWVANGFSGHGFKLAPAVGAMLARAITGERRDFDTEVPLSLLAVDREPLSADTHSVIA